MNSIKEFLSRNWVAMKIPTRISGIIYNKILKEMAAERRKI
jgi:hypothetical protein